MLNPRDVDRGPAGFSVILESAAGVHLVRVGGSIGVLGAALLGSRLLATLNDGAGAIVVDLGRAEALAPGALLATLSRVDRYAHQRDARLVVVTGVGNREIVEHSAARRWLTVAPSREEAVALLGGA